MRVRKPTEKLTRKQRLFVAAYIKHRGNATAAAREAGYAHPNKQGSVLARKEHIARHIDFEFARAGMTAERVLYELSEIAQRGYADYIRANGTVDLAAMKRDRMMHLIKKVTTERVFASGDSDGYTDKLRVEFYDGMTALTWIGKHHKMFTDRIDHSGEIATPITIVDFGLDDDDDEDDDGDSEY